MDDVLTPAAFRSVRAEVLTGDAAIVVLAPHPDDESLACGGLLAHAFAHRGAAVICMTDGSASHPGSRDWPPARLAERRRKELEQAVGHLGGSAEDVTWLGHPDGWLGTQDGEAIAWSIAQICRARQARHLFAPSPADHHEDHKATARIAHRVAAMEPGLTLFHYPVWSRWDESDFAAGIARHDPMTFADKRWQARKRRAIAAHATQLGQLVQDDPDGFVMSAAFVSAFADHPEIFWEAPR